MSRDDTFDLFIVFEQWRPIPNFPYEVSNLGHLRKVNKDGSYRSIQACPNGLGYFCVVLTDYNHNKKTFYLHRLVGEAFLPPSPNGWTEINHLTEDKAFNEVYGIEWTTRKLNCNYGARNEKIGAGHSKVVEQYSLDGKLLATYSSTRAAAEHCGVKSHGIAQCARGESKTAYGYCWKYKESEN